MTADLLPLQDVERSFRGTSDSELVVAVRQRIARQPGAPAGLNQLAATLGVAPSRLSAAFQRSLGISVAVYARNERMRIAQRMLLQTSYPIQDIAIIMGFSGAANFSSAFRQFTGTTPRDFRNNPPEYLALTTNTDIRWGQGPV